MFILYSVLIGLIVGVALGGRISGVANLDLRWSWLIVAGLAIQVALFSGPVSERIGDLGPWLYVTSTAAVIGAVLANRSITGMPIVALGACMNLAAIAANGGYMPADPGAMAALGRLGPAVYSNSAIVADPALRSLTDLFALPSWLPFANVFSLGDVVIGVGIVVTIAASMRRSAVRADNSPEGARLPSTPEP